MLFNSYAFLCGFLPLALLAFFALGRSAGGRLALPIITAFSLAFYAYWDWRNLGVLVPSLLINFVIGHSLSRRPQKPLLIAGLVLNLGVLGVFKYADFALGTVNAVAGSQLPLVRIALPLGISFFTFEQIAYIVDAYRGRARQYSFAEYAFFVTFFPHLIAGPIIQHDELLNQTKGDLGRALWKPRAENLALGAAFLIIGLFKKVVIADRCAPFVSPYDRIALGFTPTFVEAWLATFGYSLQLYFDFSGYSDMAIGLARMLNLRLPENFASPYKAHNPIEFWRRWHMTLSRFLRVYLYIPLGGNRGSTFRRYTNIFVTMALGGLWHGAGWGFVLWGSINGVYLIINNIFRSLRGAPRDNAPEGPSWLVELCRTWTFFLIMISRVFFRAPDLRSSWTMLKSLFTLGDFRIAQVAEAGWPVAGFTALYVFCRAAPNSQQVFAHLEPVVGQVLYPSPRRLALSPSTALLLAAMAVSSFLLLNHVSTFLYFQF